MLGVAVGGRPRTRHQQLAAVPLLVADIEALVAQVGVDAKCAVGRCDAKVARSVHAKLFEVELNHLLAHELLKGCGPEHVLVAAQPRALHLDVHAPVEAGAIGAVAKVGAVELGPDKVDH